MQKVSVIGSTGSIGTSALDVISRFPERFRVDSLSTHSNAALLWQQAQRFRPKAVCIINAKKAQEFRKRFEKERISLYEGEAGLLSMMKRQVDTLVVGVVGSSALLPILTALPNIRRLALANKEALVMAGDIIMQKAKCNKVTVLPVDSEHSAIFQCIGSKDPLEIKNIYLTGSGGPLLRVPKKDFRKIGPAQAVNHPKWKMGKKISIDSATMMNKGLEVIEAHHLFGVEIDNIKILIHPETVVHSMVEFVDGSILAQMGTCDMRTPIQYALTYPSRDTSPVEGVMFSKLRALHFDTPDFVKFPCLRLAYEAAQRGDTYPCALNASNEVVVEEFLKGRLRFPDIPKIIERILSLHKNIKTPKLEDILEVDKWAKEKTVALLK